MGCQLFIEQAQANIAAMQQQLYFSPDPTVSPEFTIIYTPTLKISGFPNQRIIAVNLDNYTTRILGTDYFGESKKGGLRMWNKWVYERGGLALHAGCKVWPKISGKEKLALVIGLSGTGKTTTTFQSQLGSLPVQDDFCALFPGGKVYASENGCFAKTYGLDPLKEPIIYHALTQPDAWLEHVAVSPDGKVNFMDGTYSSNGRGTFSLESINHRSPINLPGVSYIFILNRNFNIMPAVVKLRPEQAAAYFMLGETTGTSAGGDDESGKFLRVARTNPFFFGDDALQGNRFLELLKSMPEVGVYVMNTGRVGGTEEDPDSKKVHISDNSAILEGIVRGMVEWQLDSNFGYFAASHVPGIEDKDILAPQILYEKLGRERQYIQLVNTLINDRINYLSTFHRLNREIAL